jgi:hypothetical protein
MERSQNQTSIWTLSRGRFVNVVVGINALLLYEAARAYYRPDTLGNSLGTVTIVFVALLGGGCAHDYFVMRSVTITVLLYEVAQLGKPIDPLDTVATVLAGVLCESFYRLLHGRAAEQPQLE